jgi:hypothetical protein
MGANSSPLPSAIDAANANNEVPADSSPICGDMLTTRPFHLVIRPPSKSSPPVAQDKSSDIIKMCAFNRRDIIFYLQYSFYWQSDML